MGESSEQNDAEKNYKDSEGFVENIGISRSTIYFKIGLYKLFLKKQDLKNSIFSHYFRNSFEMIKIVCKSNEELFTLNKNRTMVVLLFLVCFPCFVVRLFITPQDFLFSRENVSQP